MVRATVTGRASPTCAPGRHDSAAPTRSPPAVAAPGRSSWDVPLTPAAADWHAAASRSSGAGRPELLGHLTHARPGRSRRERHSRRARCSPSNRRSSTPTRRACASRVRAGRRRPRRGQRARRPCTNSGRTSAANRFTPRRRPLRGRRRHRCASGHGPGSTAGQPADTDTPNRVRPSTQPWRSACSPAHGIASVDAEISQRQQRHDRAGQIADAGTTTTGHTLSCTR